MASPATPPSVAATATALPSTRTRGLMNHSAIAAASTTAKATARPSAAGRPLPVPAAISTGIGSQVQQPLACVIVGGMLLSPICSLLVIPVLARLWMPTIKETGMREVAAH